MACTSLQGLQGAALQGLAGVALQGDETVAFCKLLGEKVVLRGRGHSVYLYRCQHFGIANM
eukprot:1181860-Lingulodinium_polyedra.AAC.1